MQSKGKKAQTKDEATYVALVASLPCSVCDSPGPSSVHEIKQGQWWTAIALCWGCHQSPHNGWHGSRSIWKVRKMELLDALAVTVRRVFERLIHAAK